MQTAKATIKSSAKVFNFFSDNTYTMNFLAVVRELVANGVDSHTDAGIPDVPVEVWLPTDLDPTFRVRDRGIGMSRQFMMTTYTVLGDGSTKDGSDDKIGGFGIGRFSAFGAGTDQYTVRSVHDGVLSVYSVFKDEDGIPTVGLFGESVTDEPNGVEVSFPVKSEDFGKFAEAANDALKFFNPLPILYNGEIDQPDYIMRGKTWAINRKSGPLGVIMGGLRYQVNAYNLPYELRYHADISPLFDYGLDITVPIGTCGVALSRENLAYNEKTFAGLTQSLSAVLSEITDSFSTMFDAYETEWEAKQALCLEVPLDQTHGARGKLLLGNAKYRGQELVPEVELTATHWTIDSKSRGRHGAKNIGSAKWEYQPLNIRLDRYEVVIIDDLPLSPKSATIKRIKTLLEEECNRNKPSIVLRDATFATAIPDCEFVFTSSLPEPERVKREKTDRPKVRMFKLRHLTHNFNPGRYGRSDVSEIDYWSQPETGILVIADKFNISSDDFTKLQTELVKFEECHFVNTVDGTKLKNWKLLKDVFNERLQEIIDETPDLPLRLAVRNDITCRHLFSKLRHLQVEDFPKSKQKSPAARVVDIRTKYLTEITSQQAILAPFITSKMPAGLDLQKLCERFETHHPKANHYLDYTGVIQPGTLDHSIFMDLI